MPARLPSRQNEATADCEAGGNEAVERLTDSSTSSDVGGDILLLRYA
jgi:hypothetical protein